MRKIYVCLLSVTVSLSAFAQYKGIEMADSLSEIYGWNKYPTYKTYIDFMTSYADKYQSLCRLDTVGYSSEGKIILALKIYDKQKADVSKPHFFISAAIHGDELTGSIMLMRLIDTLLVHSDNFADFYDKLEIYVCPFMNPDGTWINENDVSYAERYNANLVDLNRNYKDIRFPNKETSDGEDLQPENQAFMEYQNKEEFSLSCNLHTGSEVFNFPFDCYTSKERRHAHYNWFVQLGKAFVDALDSKGTNYFRKETLSGIIDGGDWYVIGGSHQDWSTYYAHCPEVTVEISDNKMPKSADLPVYWKYLNKSLLVYTDYATKGFGVCVHDSDDYSVLIDSAELFVKDYDKYLSQVFTNKQGYGFRVFYDTVVELVISKEGYESRSITLNTLSSETYNVCLKKKDVSLTETTNPHTVDIFPNPAENTVNVRAYNGVSCILYDVNKKQLGSWKINNGILTLHLDGYPSGIYVLKTVFNDGTVNNGRFIKIK